MRNWLNVCILPDRCKPEQCVCVCVCVCVCGGACCEGHWQIGLWARLLLAATSCSLYCVETLGRGWCLQHKQGEKSGDKRGSLEHSPLKEEEGALIGFLFSSSILPKMYFLFFFQPSFVFLCFHFFCSYLLFTQNKTSPLWTAPLWSNLAATQTLCTTLWTLCKGIIRKRLKENNNNFIWVTTRRGLHVLMLKNLSFCILSSPAQLSENALFYLLSL